MEIDVDSHKLIYHPGRVVEWLETGDCFPIYVEIGVTNRCNHRCIFCALDWFKKNPIDIDSKVMKTAIQDIADCNVKSIMFAGEGEPLLHPDIIELTLFTKQKGLDVSITTNGVLFNEKMAEQILPALSWIRFSVDSGSPEMHKKIHAGGTKDFDKIISNIKEAVCVKKRRGLSVVIGVQFLLIPENIQDIVPFVSIFQSLGVDNVQIKPYSQHPLSNNRFCIPYSDYKNLEEEVKKFERSNFQVIFRSKTTDRLICKRDYNECYGLPFFVLIEADGSVIPCMMFYQNQDFCYGNINNISFREIWLSETRKNVLKKMKMRNIDQCREGCRLDAINRYLHQLKHPHPHVNFI